MKVISVNIGEKRTINYKGKIVETGIFKSYVHKQSDPNSISDNDFDERNTFKVPKTLNFFAQIQILPQK